MSDKPRILTLDIETAPIVAHVWGLFDQNVGLNQIVEDSNVLCFAAKWLEDPKMIFHSTGGRGAKKVRDDKILMQPLWDLLDEADIVVGQNLNSFDIKRINARLVKHGYPPYSPIRTVDTMRMAKSRLGMSSNKLAWLSAQLTTTVKSEHRKYPGHELWLAVLKDDPEAWLEMKKYNIQDVRATEELYLTLRPWAQSHPSVSAYSSGEIRECPKCGSEDLHSNGWRFLQGGKYKRYQCKGCGGWCRGKAQALTTDKRKAMLVNA